MRKILQIRHFHTPPYSSRQLEVKTDRSVINVENDAVENFGFYVGNVAIVGAVEVVSPSIGGDVSCQFSVHSEKHNMRNKQQKQQMRREISGDLVRSRRIARLKLLQYWQRVCRCNVCCKIVISPQSPVPREASHLTV